MTNYEDAGWLGTLRWLQNRSDAAPVGEFFAPSQEAFRLHASIRLGFPARAIESATQNATHIRIVSPLFGLSGPVAALPYAYTEQLAKATRENGTALPDFFDIFNHRAQSLLYRALSKHRFVLDKEPAHGGGEPDRYTRMTSALSGLLATETLSGDTADTGSGIVPPDALAGFAGLFARRTRSASGLTHMLQGYFELDIRIRQFAGRWVSLDEQLQSRIGTRCASNNQLGSCLLGRRSWQATGFFCVEIHNPNACQFAALQPEGALLHALHLMVRRYAGEELGFHIEIFTGPQLQATARLRGPSGVIDNGSTTRLGWCGVLGRPERSAGAAIKIGRLRSLSSGQSTPAYAAR